MYQCRLEKDTQDGIEVKVGYIEERAAKVGNLVTIKGEEGYWLVKTVSEPTLSSQVYKQQIKNRNPFRSLD